MARTAEQRPRLLAAAAIALFLTVGGCVFAVRQGYDKGWRLMAIAITANLASSTLVYIFVSWGLGLASDDDDGHSAKIIVEPLLKAIRSIPSARGYADSVDVAAKLSELQVAIRALQGATLLESVDWKSLIGGASAIDFVVQGWDGWFQKYESELRLFLERGGKFRLYIYDPYSPQSAPARALMVERLGKTPHEVTSEITDTIDTLEAIRDSLPPDKRTASHVEIHRTIEINWYFAARFIGAITSQSSKNRDAIVFSVYSHTPRRPHYMPALTLDPGVHPDMTNWFDAELAHLRRPR